jgi:SAM-dependent methyltransferase
MNAPKVSGLLFAEQLVLESNKEVQPIRQAVHAKPHRPVYRMHRYFARRPYSVFSELVRHYSTPDDVILDPFCGGGVTLVEGALLGRRVVGFDINPLAAFITRMEVADVELDGLKQAQETACRAFQTHNDRLFSTACRRCRTPAPALWFEYSSVAECRDCQRAFRISEATKPGMGTWQCTHCSAANKFSPSADTNFDVVKVLFNCASCGHREIAAAEEADEAYARSMEAELRDAEAGGLWIPDADIPDCNMQRESALFKKGINKFRQLFTPRHLLALGLLRKTIVELDSPFQEWLLFCFSSALRYTNRMVTSNTDWRGERPLEWAKPGYWLPPVHLEANVLEEFSRRCDSVLRGKRDYLSKLPPLLPRPQFKARAAGVLEDDASSFHVSTRSSTDIPLQDQSVDLIITDPPYGSYVHYADLSNFWTVWLRDVEGLGTVIDNREEAVIARKSFPGAKNAGDYLRLLEGCFSECARVLKDGGYMVLTFHNREPRAWAALYVAAVKAGFELPDDGIVFQDGIQSYKHTAQQRRAGSVIGDFILSFRKLPAGAQAHGDGADDDFGEPELIEMVRRLLREHGALTPDALMALVYLEYQPRLMRKVRTAVAQGSGAAERLIEDADSIQLFDSHRRQLLEQHFCYENEEWSLRAEDE